MSMKKILIAGLTATALMMQPLAALAQDNTTPPPADTTAPTPDTTTPPATDATTPAAPDPNKPLDAQIDPNRPAAQNWLKVCDPIDGGKKACIMRQVILSNNQFVGSFLLRDDPGQESRLLAVAAVPLGVLLPFGLTWQIDGGKPIRVPFMLCDPQSCATQLVINEAYVNSLKKGSKLFLTAKNRKNEDLKIEINLSGFTSVYDGEAALTFEEFRNETSGNAALEQQLQDRAEELRQQLNGTTEPSVGTPADNPPDAVTTTPPPADAPTPPAQ